jgi:hypothetical protein
MINENKNKNENLININTDTSNAADFNFDAYFELEPAKKSPKFINFLTWLVGYAEGNGGIYTNHYKNYHITHFDINSRDLKFLENIQKKLNFGQIYTRTYLNGILSYTYRARGKENINKIIQIFNGNAQLQKTYQQLLIWHQTSEKYADPSIKLKTILPIQNKITLNNAWLSGLLDADAYWSVILSKNKKVFSKFALKFTCGICQKTDVEVLETIRKILDSKTKIINHPSRVDNFMLCIQSLDALNILVKYLEDYPLKTKDKKASLKKWQKFLPLGYQKNLAPLVQDKKAFLTLKKQIKAINNHSTKSKFYKKDLNKEKSE